MWLGFWAIYNQVKFCGPVPNITRADLLNSPPSRSSLRFYSKQCWGTRNNCGKDKDVLRLPLGRCPHYHNKAKSEGRLWRKMREFFIWVDSAMKISVFCFLWVSKINQQNYSFHDSTHEVYSKSNFVDEKFESSRRRNWQSNIAFSF